MPSITRRRLPQHAFVQHPTMAQYTSCVYPDPDNVVSGVCAMGRSWHIRDAEERAAEAAETVHETGPDSTVIDEGQTQVYHGTVVTYEQAKAAARSVTATILVCQQTSDIDELTTSAAFELLKRWANQRF